MSGVSVRVVSRGDLAGGTAAARLGAGHPDTTAACAELTAAYQAVRKIATALQLQEQAGADYQQLLGADHPRTLAHHAGLARVYHAAGDSPTRQPWPRTPSPAASKPCHQATL